MNYNFNYLQNNLLSKVIDLFKKSYSGNEIECVYNVKNKLSRTKYIYLLQFLKLKSSKENLKLETKTTIDIGYNYDVNNINSYRITLEDLDYINELIDDNMYMRKNNVIFGIFINMILTNTCNKEKLYVIEKIKNNENLLEIPEFDMKMRLSDEKNISNDVLSGLIQLNDRESHNINFRFKQRISLILEDNDYFTLKIDLTDVKTSKSLVLLKTNNSRYELELDLTVKKSGDKMVKKLIDYLPNYEKKVILLLKLLQNSSNLCDKQTVTKVINNLNLLCYGENNEMNYKKDLPGMQTTSTEIQHIVDIIPGKYSVTDKADGDRCFLMIHQQNIYLITNNLEVRNITPGDVDKNILLNYDETIIDGEYIFIEKYNKYLFLAFDLLFLQKKDIREEIDLQKRLTLLNTMMNEIFDLKINMDKIENNVDINVVKNNHITIIKEHFKSLNDTLKNSKNTNIIHTKYFIFPFGGYGPYEIYYYSQMIWELYTKDTSINCPYKLDGLIYTPLKQKYTRNLRDTKYKIYKWKPEEKNSIDFYITFERNSETNKIMNVFDNSEINSLKKYLNNTDLKQGEVDYEDVSTYQADNKLYRIVNLHVGHIKNGIETPVLFLKESDNYKAYLPVEITKNNKEGIVRDIEGNIIMDNTVVEFAYNNDIRLSEPFKWVPLKTRYDKTESVINHKKKYGNNEQIAKRIWYSMQYTVTFNDIMALGNLKTSEEQFKLLRLRVNNQLINTEKKGDKYYQLVNSLGENMRSFHNFIKSNIIYTYCSHKTLQNKNKVQLRLLDFGTGRGGDLLKFYHARIKEAVLLDISADNLYSATDGAISRYTQFKQEMPNFPKMNFIVADVGAKLNLDAQVAAIGSMTDQNTQLIKQIFGPNDNSQVNQKFDIINVQFMVHYILKNEITWKNFCDNINKTLNNDGYVLITTFDAYIVDKAFDKNGKISRYYNTDDGEQRYIFDIKKNYTDTNLDQLGLPIDVHIPIFMDDGVYMTEYLVSPKFLITSLKTNCNLRLVETDLFENLFNIYKDFFETTAEYEENLKTKNFFMQTKKFYNMNDENNRNWFDFSRLNRYYIFQKDTK